MDVYHKILLKLYEVTNGKDSVTTDLKDHVKNQGFLGNYNDIFQMLNGQGWIAETPKLNFVKITHWGVKEVKKTGTEILPQLDVSKNDPVKNEVSRIVAEAKQLLFLLERLSSKTSKENFEQVEKKVSEINSAIGRLKMRIE